MLNSLSPYALLKLSKPTQPAVYTTPYDLYSAAIHQNDDSIPQIKQDFAPSPIQPSPSFTTSKTHYIADIKKRHNFAARTAQNTHDTRLSK